MYNLFYIYWRHVKEAEQIQTLTAIICNMLIYIMCIIFYVYILATGIIIYIYIYIYVYWRQVKEAEQIQVLMANRTSNAIKFRW
jgi:hypothetical protein